MKITRALPVLFALSVVASSASASCVNRFVARTENPRQIVTLLTGMLTFQEAQAMATAITKKQSPPLEWVTPDGKMVAKQYGDLKVVRPMPVGCDGRTSGVVIVAMFASPVPPEKTMHVKLKADMTVVFEQQSE